MRTSAILLGLLLLAAGRASAQEIWGSSTIDIDPSTSTVTATCSTEVDETTEGAYNAQVDCSVTDGNGNLIQAEQGYDDGTGYAEATVTFPGTPGTTYNVTGTHFAFAYLDYGEYYDQPIVLGWADDPFDFLSFAENPGDYSDYFSLEGPGPEQQTRQRRLKTASTHAKRHYPKATISIAFSGSKSSQDQLSFEAQNSNECSESLGLQDCSSSKGWWHWSLEGSFHVSDDASNWTVVQTASSISEAGTDSDSQGNIRNFSVTSGGGLDGPSLAFLQRTPGTTNGFWIDSPGTVAGIAPDGGTIITLDWLQHYTVQICSTTLTSVCASKAWNVHLKVNGGVLSATSSASYE